MQKIITIFVFLGFQILGFSQKDFIPDLSGFSKSTLKKARANDDITYMTDAEKEVVFYMNLVRMEPQVFLETIVRPYVKEYFPNKNYYVNTLIADLKKARSIRPIEMKQDLYKIAYNHRVDIGKNGINGHTGSKGKTFTKRTKSALKTYYGTSENIGFGYFSPIENVLELLIDVGVKSFGHRHTILSDKYTNCGVSIGSHAYYQECCVIDYGILK